MPQKKQYHLASNKRTVAIIFIGVIVIAALVASLFFFISPNGDCTLAMYESTFSGNPPLSVTIILTEQTCAIQSPITFKLNTNEQFNSQQGEFIAGPNNQFIEQVASSGASSTFTVTLPAAGTYYPVGTSVNNGGQTTNVEGGAITVGSTSTSTTSTVSTTSKSSASVSSAASSQIQGLSIISLSPNGVGGTSSVSAGSTVQFGVTVSGGQQPYSYAWSFGGGASATSQSPTFSFPSPGTSTVSLIVTDAAGRVVGASETFDVVPAGMSISSVSQQASTSTQVSQSVTTIVTTISSNVTSVVSSNGQQTTITYGTTYVSSTTSQISQEIAASTELLIAFLVVVFAAVIAATVISRHGKKF
jgi:hypothetical protein